MVNLKRHWRGFAGIIFAAVFCAAAMLPAMAAGTVSSVSIRFEDRYEAGVILEPEITCTTEGVSIESVSWSRDPENWSPGSRVTATLILSSDEGLDFSSSYGSRTCKISGASLSGAKESGGNLKVTVSYYPVVQLGETEEAGWSATDRRTAKWKRVRYATGYQLLLYRDNNYIRTISVTGNSADLSEYMTTEANYYYEVRAMGKDSSDAKYRKSGEYVMSTDRLLDDMGDTEGTWKNYAEGRKYISGDGTEIAGCWYKINDYWYYFNADGYMATGWVQDNGLWYYMGEDGIMLTGWQKVGDLWYYLNPDGSMATGWVQGQPGEWYYMYEDGSMAANTTIDGKWVNESGLYTDAD